jgi:hypothetical protein
MTYTIATGVAVTLLLLSGLYWMFAGMPARVVNVARAKHQGLRPVAQPEETVATKPSSPPEAPALDTTGNRPSKLPSPPRVPAMRPPPLQAPDAEEPDSGRATDERLPDLLTRRAEGVVYNIGELDPKRNDEGPVSPPVVVGRVITTPPPPAPQAHLDRGSGKSRRRTTRARRNRAERDR